MRRREFITLLGGAVAAWPLAARAQQAARMRRVEVLEGYGGTDPEGQGRVGAFRDGLKALGWIDGRNVSLGVHFSASMPDRLETLATETMDGAPDLVLATTTPIAVALLRRSTSIPVVFVNVSDPIGAGLVASLSAPGGNITGFSNFEASLVEKWLDLLKEFAPHVERVGVILNPQNAASAMFLRRIQVKGSTLGVEVSSFEVRSALDIEHSFETKKNEGLIVLPEPVAGNNRTLIIELAAKHKLPAIYPFNFFAKEGGLLSYGVDQKDLYAKAASYVDRILKGEKPGNLPVQFPTKFSLVINLKTAKALGLEIPHSVLARADEVIE